MSTISKVALAGATGNLGPSILKELLDAGFHVTVLTRNGSKSTDSLPQHPNQTVKTVDYEDKTSLTQALQGIDAVVSTLGSQSIAGQEVLIDAAIAAGVSRYLPSEFGSDTTNTNSAKLPVFGGKVAIQQYLREKVVQHPKFSYTLVINGAFLDWGISTGFLVNAKEHSAKLVDGGNAKFSSTRLQTVGKGVAGVLKHPDQTKNRAVFIHDKVTTTNELIAAIEKVDKAEWKTEVVSSDDILKSSYEALGSGDQSKIGPAIVGFLQKAIQGAGYGGNFSGREDNELLGLPGLSQAEFEEVVAAAVAKA